MIRSKAPHLLALFLLFAGTSPARAEELTLYFYPAPSPLNWSSPRRLALSVAKNTFLPSVYPLKHSIGHASVQLRCGNEEIQTGMTDLNDSDETDAIFHDDAGLGVLFEKFDGRLQTAQEIQEDLDARLPDGKVASITFKISEPTCARLEEYFREYRMRGYWRHYGLSLRPRYGEGAGCSAFAISFLDVAGLLDPAFTQGWSKTLDVPESLIGENDHRVSIWSLLFSWQAGSWSESDADSRQLSFWDPETAYDWILNQTKNSAAVLVYDKTAAPTPSDSIWLQNQILTTWRSPLTPTLPSDSGALFENHTNLVR